MSKFCAQAYFESPRGSSIRGILVILDWSPGSHAY